MTQPSEREGTLGTSRRVAAKGLYSLEEAGSEVKDGLLDVDKKYICLSTCCAFLERNLKSSLLSQIMEHMGRDLSYKHILHYDNE